MASRRASRPALERHPRHLVIPAQAGIQRAGSSGIPWVPAFPGTTKCGNAGTTDSGSAGTTKRGDANTTEKRGAVAAFRSLFFAVLFCLSLLFPAFSAFGQSNPVPFVNQPLVPSAVAPGGPDFTLTVNGTGFVSGATVNWNGTPLATTFVSGSKLTATVPAADTAFGGTASVTVVNPGPGSVASNAANLEISFQVFSPIRLASPAKVFTTLSNYAVNAVATGDFNGDGHLDVAIGTGVFITGCPPCWLGKVGILLGNGEGSLVGPTYYDTPTSADSIVTGDFNGDGKLDLAVSERISGQVSVLLGNGDGTFQPHVDFSTGSGTSGLLAADFNGDGKLDLAVNVSGGVMVLLGNGDGTFQLSGISPGGTIVGAGDFNRDGKIDLAEGSSAASSVSISLGNGDGTFQTPLDYATGSGPRSLVVADLNGDGVLDLAVVNQGTGASPVGSISVLLGNGDGTFQPHVDNPLTTSPQSIVVADLNDDGKLDLAVVSFNPSQISILLGNGDGTFQTPVNEATTAEVAGMVEGDFTGDGLPDLFIWNSDFITGVNGNAYVQPELPTMSLSPANWSFADQTVGTTSVVKKFTLQNNWNSGVTITGVSFSGADSADFGETSNCPLSPSSLAGGSSCTISVTFTPSALGSRSAFLTVTDSGPGGQQVASLTGTGINPTASLSPTTLAFGNQDVRTSSAPQAVTLTNNGVGPLSITGSGITISGPNAGDFTQTNNCGTSVAQGASCTINVTFTPTTGGGESATLSITDNASTSPQNLSLTGTGVPPSVTLNPTTLTFASIGIGVTSPAQTVTLSNNGPGPLLVTKIAASGDFAASQNCLGTMAALASCDVSVTFTPTASGTRAGFLTITDDAVASPQTVTLSGTGVAPTATASPTSLSFAPTPVGTTTTSQTVTLTNGSSGPLTISSISFTGTNPAVFPQTNNCPLAPATLAAGGACTINVSFAPRINGAESATLTITDNATASPQTVSLSGTGQAPVANLSPANLDFPNQTVGQMSAAQTVTVSNSGSLPLTISSIVVTSPFAQSNNCPISPATLAAGANCTISLTFTPGFAGETFGLLLVSDNSLGSTTQPVALTGEATVDFGSVQVAATSAAQAVVVANGSTTRSVTISGVTTAGDFAVTSNNCATLAPGASCTPNVTFTPTAPGARTGSLRVAFSTGIVVGVPLSGTGLGPTATLSKTTLTFAGQAVGTTSAPTAVTITNNGNQALNINSVGIAPTGQFALATSGTTCSTTAPLAAGAQCTINVTFTPTAPGNQRATMSVYDNAPASPQTVALSGAGQDFVITTTGTTIATVSAGGTATFNFSIGSQGGYTGTVNLTCALPPALTHATCNVLPASVTPAGASPATASATVTTTAPTEVLLRPTPFGAPPLRDLRNLWILLIAIVVVILTLRVRRPRYVALALTLVTVLAWAACGGRGGNVIHLPGTPPGTYKITITATDAQANLTQTITVQLTVNP